MTRIALIALLSLLVGYGLIEGWPLLRGPVLHVETPTAYTTVTDGILTVSGRTRHTARLTLNGAPLLHDESGRFSSTLAFPSGGAILTFVAADRFGREVTETRTIFVP